MYNSRNLTLCSVPSCHDMLCFFLLHSFLLQIVTRLRKAGGSDSDSGSGSESESKRESGEKLSVFSGHDTVIAPVLAALGLYEDELCVWPPYASRIVFELWQRKGQTKSKSKDLDGAGSGSDPSLSLSVRVIFNGQDLTHRIPACKAERDAAVAATGAGTGMCSLTALEEQVKSMLGHHPSLKAAC